jgi:NADPH-dependent curcumin reductase CurA
MGGPLISPALDALPPNGLEVYLRARPDGMVEPERDFGTRRVALPDAQALGADEVLVRTLFVSCDPAMRGWMTSAPSYLPPVEIGATMRAHGVGAVVASASTQFRVGDLVYANCPVRDSFISLAPVAAFSESYAADTTAPIALYPCVSMPSHRTEQVW